MLSAYRKAKEANVSYPDKWRIAVPDSIWMSPLTHCFHRSRAESFLNGFSQRQTRTVSLGFDWHLSRCCLFSSTNVRYLLLSSLSRLKHCPGKSQKRALSERCQMWPLPFNLRCGFFEGGHRSLTDRCGVGTHFFSFRKPSTWNVKLLIKCFIFYM